MSSHTVYVTPSARRQVKDLPGHVRQRVKHAIDALGDDPHPSGSKLLELPQIQFEVKREVCRLQIAKWRIIYVITQADEAIDVLAVRKRPPYDYGDLERLLAELE